MLTELSITDLAIIDNLVIRFDAGLTVLTGETGAGKSIIIDALQLALGARASPDAVRGGAKFAFLEAIFDVSDMLDGTDLRELLEAQGMEWQDTLICRREVSANGRSAARVNGMAVPLSVLSGIGRAVVDVHGQSDHLAILNARRQLEVLDRFGGLLDAREEVGERISEWQRLQGELDRLVGNRQEAERMLDTLRFQVEEIERVAPEEGEEAELEQERDRLANAEKLADFANEAHAALREEMAASHFLQVAAGAIQGISRLDRSREALYERAQTLLYEIEDLSDELRAYRETLQYDPPRLNFIEERLDQLTRLKRKYGPALSDVLAYVREARERLEEMEAFDDRSEELAQQVQEAGARAGEAAGRLSERRLETAETLTQAISRSLEGLGLPRVLCEVLVEQTRSEEGLPVESLGGCFRYARSGIDSVSFLAGFNPGETPRPLDKVASGGETSRFLLALKSVLTTADATPTLIFDEVDVGVGGRHGSVVGERLRELAQNHQVISITHLPQVAAFADEHLSVAKAQVEDRTTVQVRSLEGPDRVSEIAQMMSGTNSEAARQGARELIAAAASGPAITRSAVSNPR